MKHSYHSRKVRQLDRLIKEMKQSMRARQPKELVDRIRQKIAVLIKELLGVLSKRQLAHKLGALAIVFGFASAAQAQQFATPVENPFGFSTDSTTYISGIALADFDNDGDFDILMGGYYGTFNYYENTGTASAPAFGTAVANPFGLGSTYYYGFLTVADLDDDGDVDVLAGEYYGNMQYFENVGTATSPLFAAPSTNPFGLDAGNAYIAMPHFVDLDDDGDFDNITGISGYYGVSLSYFENTGSATSPAFATPVANPFGMTFGGTYFANPTSADLDGDGDIDLLLGEYYGNFSYYENTGTASTPVFGTGQSNPFSLTGNFVDIIFPELVDIDNDGDYDVVGAGYYGAIIFYENTQFNVGLDEIANNVSMGPNPFQNEVNFTTTVDLNVVEVLDMTGKLVYSEVNPDGKISLEHLKRGVYMIQVVDADGRVSQQKLEKL